MEKIHNNTIQLHSDCEINASSTAAEADKFSSLILEAVSKEPSGWPIVNTGTIDPYQLLWGKTEFTNKGKKYLRPFLVDNKKIISQPRRTQYSSPKIIFAKVARRIEAAFDLTGTYASINTNFVFAEGRKGLYYLGLLNSKLMTWVYEQYFGALRMSGGYLQFQSPQLRILPVIAYDDSITDCIEIADLVKLFIQKPDKSQDLLQKLDRLVYQIYGLDEIDIKIIEGRSS